MTKILNEVKNASLNKVVWISLLIICGGIISFDLAVGKRKVESATIPVTPIASTDFVVADNGGKVAVYDQNLLFKGYLDASLNGAYGVDFLPNGSVVATGRSGQGEIRIYNTSGLLIGGFMNTNIGPSACDVKTSSSNLLYVGPGTGNIPEFDAAGTKNRKFGNAMTNYTGVVVLPGNKLWGNQFNPTIDVFDLTMGSGDNIAPSNSFMLDNGQSSAQTMTYSPTTNTVLTTQNNGNVFERNLSGGLVRQFDMSTVPPSMSSGPYHAFAGVTRGPNGDVFVTAFNGTGQDAIIARFNGTTGAFISVKNIAPGIMPANGDLMSPCNIIWAGNVGAGSPCAITCPAPVTKASDPNQCGAIVTYPAPTSTGTCSTITCTPPSGNLFPVGTTTVTCMEASGSSCSFTVTVNDTQAPSITCPANVTAKTGLNSPCAVVNFTATASDNCPGVGVVCNPPSGSCFALGTTTVTCTATDAHSNTAACSFTVSVFNVCVQDDSNPAIVFLGNSVTGVYRFCCSGTIFTGTASVTKLGNIVTFQHNPADRRLLVKDDETVFKGTGSLQFPVGVTKCSITDRDTRNNSCVCP